MIDGRMYVRRLQRKLIAIGGSSMFALGILGSCDDQLVGLTRFVDPCGTFLANCAPGSFEVNAADVGDFCVDPACTVPGACDNAQPLGTITDICP